MIIRAIPLLVTHSDRREQCDILTYNYNKSVSNEPIR